MHFPFLRSSFLDLAKLVLAMYNLNFNPFVKVSHVGHLVRHLRTVIIWILQLHGRKRKCDANKENEYGQAPLQ